MADECRKIVWFFSGVVSVQSAKCQTYTFTLCSHILTLLCSFIWDTVRELRNFSDVGFIAHGATCLAIYANAFVSEHATSSQVAKSSSDTVAPIPSILRERLLTMGSVYAFTELPLVGH